MEKIHKDYTKSLGELAKHMDSQEMPPKKLLDWLIDRRKKLESERIDIRHYDEEIRWTDLYKKNMESVIGYSVGEYAKAILEYFYVPNSIFHLSFYSHVEQTLKGFLIFLQKKPHTDVGIAKKFYDSNEVKDVYEVLRTTIDNYLPKGWSRVSRNYRRLRGLLLN